MSSPFRSEIEQLQETLRRSEERAERLDEEKQVLEQTLMQGRPRFFAVAAALVIGTLVGGSGFFLGRTQARSELSRKHATDLALRDTEAVVIRRDLLEEKLRHEACAKRELASQRTHAIPQASAPTTRGGPPCPCHPADPLCSCD